MKRKGSKTTGSRKAAKTQPSVTGLQPGATGSVSETSSAGGLLVVQQAKDPAETDAALIAMLKRLLGPQFALKERSIDGDHGFERTVVEKAVLPAGTTHEVAQQALELVETVVRPAEPAALGRALSNLYKKTLHRSQSTVDAEATASAYIEELLAYPGDVALAALAERRHYWPSWAELARDCDRLVAPRRAISRALEQILAAPDAPAPIKRIPGSFESWEAARQRHGIPARRAKELEPKKLGPRPPDYDQLIVQELGPEKGNRYLQARMDGKGRKEALAAARLSETAFEGERTIGKTKKSA
jgi:hypothetical protein